MFAIKVSYPVQLLIASSPENPTVLELFNSFTKSRTVAYKRIACKKNRVFFAKKYFCLYIIGSKKG